MSEASPTKNKKLPKTNLLNKLDLSIILIRLGIALVILSGLFTVAVFHPLLISEFKYILANPNENARVVLETASPNQQVDQKYYVKTADPDFGLVIPKIGANSSVVANVNPYDSRIYQQALTKGVAHAEGTVFPGQIGNTFLFSHSSVNVYDANRYNSVFFLLRKLDVDDIFYITYQGKVYKYEVFDKKIVEAEDVEYLDTNTEKNQATLMTCWPPGTTLKRLVVLGELVQQD